jgi:hypothetical protein
MGDVKYLLENLIGALEGRKLLRRRRPSWKNIKNDFMETDLKRVV